MSSHLKYVLESTLKETECSFKILRFCRVHDQFMDFALELSLCHTYWDLVLPVAVLTLSTQTHKFWPYITIQYLK